MVSLFACVTTSPLSAQSVTALKTPSVTWKVSSLLPSSNIKTSAIASTNSAGKQTWTVKGNCSLSGSRIKTTSTGTCSITLTIAKKSPYSSRAVHKNFPIKAATASVTSFDPYAGVSASVTSTGTIAEHTLTTPDGRTRRYRTYVPPGLNANSPVPLVIALHGGLGTSSQFETNSGLDGFADSNKFIAVYPDGIGNLSDGSGYQTWNGGYCCGPAAANAVDDVTFIKMVVAELRRTMPINTNRIYAMGHSNGGILSYRLACELSDVIAAIGVQAGSNIVSGCSPRLPVSVFHLHGTSDTNMPIDGGKGTGVSATNFVSARSSVEAVAQADGCSDSTPKSMVTSNPDVSALSWTSCKSNVEVRFVTVKGATHAWMGHPGTSASSTSLVGVPYANLDATRAILAFLLSKSR